MKITKRKPNTKDWYSILFELDHEYIEVVYYPVSSYRSNAKIVIIRGQTLAPYYGCDFLILEEGYRDNKQHLYATTDLEAHWNRIIQCPEGLLLEVML